MAEEHRCEAPEGHRLCANNCGFFGSPATLNLCSKCYRDLRLKEEQASSAKSAVEKSLSSASASASAASNSTAPLSPPALALPEAANEITAPGAVAAAGPPPSSSHPSRCSTCRKRVGLTGFRCRCGITFCGAHRYPEQHGCTFDFKKLGKEAISKANPVVKAEKLRKI